MDEITNKRILIADDEEELLKMTSEILEKDGFSYVYTAKTCREAVNITREKTVALFVLDVNFPDGSGFSLYNDIRKLSDAPIIFLTARGDGNDKLEGLSLGADDYIVKPFLPGELLLRIKAVLRRTYSKCERTSSFRLGDRVIDFGEAAVICQNKKTPLTAKEYILLKKLYDNKNKIVTSDSLCMAAWGDGYYGYENTLMVHIRRLRKKIEADPSNPAHLLTVKGLGYKLVTGNE